MKVVAMLAMTAVIGLWGVERAQAASTTVASPPRNEDSHADIFSHLYGGTFTHNSPDLSNGSVTANRVDDDNDQLIAAGEYEIQAMAVFADYNHWFGYMPGETGDEFVGVLDSEGYGYDVNDGTHTVTVDEPFRWVRKGQGEAVSSLDSDNSDGEDHFVTYEMEGSNEQLIFIEDRTGNGADHDFQDLVLRITPVGGGNDNGNGGDGANAAPTPTALGAGLALLVGTTLIGRRDRRRR